VASIYTIKRAARKLIGEELLKEYLTDEQRKEYSKTSMSDKARKQTDHFFGTGVDLKKENIKNYDGDKSEVHRAVERHIGKEITQDEYKKGLTKDKYDRPVRLGGVIKDESLRNEFAKDNTRAGAKKDNGHYATIVRGVEVAGQTNSSPDKNHPRGHSWGEFSCKNVDDGTQRRYLEDEIKHGTTVVRVHDHNDKEIYRATLQPHHNDEGHVAYSIDSEYGVKHDSFTRHANDVARRLSGEHKGGSPIYEKHPDVYSDSGTDTMIHPSMKAEDLLKDKNTKTEVVNHFAQKENEPEHILAALSHPNADEETTAHAAQNKNYPHIAMAALNHPKADSYTTQVAVKNSDRNVAMAALNHPKADARTTHNAVLGKNGDDLAFAALNHPKADAKTTYYTAENHNNPKAAIAALDHPLADENTLMHGARNYNQNLALSAMTHKKATTKVLESSLYRFSGENNDSRDEFLSKTILNHPAVDHDVILKMASITKNPSIAKDILDHPKVSVPDPFKKSTHIVNALMNTFHDDNPDVALNILNHPQSNHTTTEIGATSVHPAVGVASLQHKNAYYETAHKAIRNQNPDIAKAALNSEHASASHFLQGKIHDDDTVAKLANKKIKEAGIQEEKTVNIVETIKKAAKSAKKKKMSKQDEKLVRDYEEREKAEKGYDDDAIRYGMKESAFQMDESDSGLAAKARKSGVSLGTLQKVYRRGVAAWNSGHRPGTTPQQWGMARVNSYITKGKGTYHGADKDLREEELLEVAKDKESGLPKKYVSGLSSSTAKARAAHWDKMDKLSDRDPAAYEPAPGDATAKTRESKHTIKAREMFEQLAPTYDGIPSVYDARPKQKTDVDVSGHTDGKKINYVYTMRGRRLGDSNPAHREFASIRIGDTELAKKEKEVADRLNKQYAEYVKQERLKNAQKGSPTIPKPLKEAENKITSKIVKGIVHINGKPLNHSSVEVDGVNKKDYPDFADAYTSRAEFKDGSELSHEELEHLDMNHPEVAHEAAHESIRGGSSKLQVMEDKKQTGTPKQRSGTCWSGYTQYGMKMKKGRSVPNCVKDK